MKKILDKEFRNSLKESLELARVDRKNISTIITTQYQQAIKEIAIDRLETIIKLLKSSDYEIIETILVKSTAVNSTGKYDYHMDFSDIPGCNDLIDVVGELKNPLKVYDD